MDRRASYFNCIEEKLSTLSFRISQRGKLNLQDFNILAEDFYALLLNLVYGYSLTNINATRHNAEAIDLIDDTSKRLVQVSSVATKTKIQDALDKSSLNNYKGYTFMFMSISKDASNLRKSSYTVPTEVNFSPLHDILDVTSVLSTVKSFDTAKTYKVYQLIQRELGSDVPLDKLDSDLTQIINTLFDMNSDVDIELTQSQTYNIDKKIDYNKLDVSVGIINEYKVYHNKIEQKYNEFNKFGASKSLIVLNSFKSAYTRILSEDRHATSDDIFLKVIASMKNQVMDSKNFNGMSFEALEFYISLLTTDAFVRCKIFQNPEGYSYAPT